MTLSALLAKEVRYLRIAGARLVRAAGSSVGVAVGLGVLLAATIVLIDVIKRGTSRETPTLFVFRVAAHPERGRTPYQLFADYALTSLGASSPDSQEARCNVANGLRVATLPTNGSFDTVLAIEAIAAWNSGRTPSIPQFLGGLPKDCRFSFGSTYAIGIVQSDVLFHYLNGGHPQFPRGQPESSIRALARLFPEWLHLYAGGKKGERPPRVADFALACGADEGSGNLVTALNVAALLQTNWRSQVHICDRPSEDETTSRLQLRVISPSPTIQADLGRLFFLTPAEAQIIENAFGSQIYRVVPNIEVRRRYQAIVPSDESIATVAVSGVLVTDKTLPESVLRRIRSVLDSLDDKKAMDGDARIILTETTFSEYTKTRTSDLPIAMHKQIKLSTAASTLARLVASERVSLAARLVIALLFVSFLAKQLAIARGNVTGLYAIRRWVVLLSLFVMLHLFVAVLVWQAEYHADTLRPETALATGNFGTALDWIFHYGITNESKYELRSYYSLGCLAILRGGYALSAIVLSITTVSRITAAVREVWMHDHVVVLGWNRRASHLVQELQRLGQEFKIVVNAAQRIDAEVATSTITRNDSLAGGLTAAQVRDARAVIVLANEPDTDSTADQADLWVARAVTEVKNYLANQNRREPDVDSKKRIPILAEVNDQRHRDMILALGVDRVVCLNQFGAELLAQGASKRPELMDVHLDLAQTTMKSHEIFSIPVTPEEHATVRGSYDELVRQAMTGVDSSERTLVIGLISSGGNGRPRQPRIAPFGEMIKPGDEAIVIAHNQPARVLPIRKA